MPKSRSTKESTKGHTLVGSWANCDEYATEVEYIVTSHGTGFRVRAIDRYDGEVADVFEVGWDGNVLSFATQWNSTGRFLRCRMQAISKNRISYTYTFTDNETWHRKST